MRDLVEQRRADVLVTEPSLTEGDDQLVDDYAKRQPNVTFLAGDPRGPTSNMFRVNPDGAAVSAGLGAYAYRTLGWRTAVTFGEDDSFGWPIAAGFITEFCALGGTVVARYWTPFGTDAWGAKVRQIPPGVDGVALMAGLQATKSFFAAYRKLQADLPRHVVMSAYPLKLGGTAPAGVVSAGYLPLASHAQSWSRYQREFARASPQYAREAGGETDIFSYDPVAATLDAIDRVHGDLSAGQRQFRVALGSSRVQTPVGTVRLDGEHRYVGPNFLMRMEAGADGKLVAQTMRVVPGVDATQSDPATPTKPVCRKGDVPSWVR
jgi:branched-chain amino acid transport system substrate-binding protein